MLAAGTRTLSYRAPAGGGALVTFGMVPDRPETGDGYIRRGADEADAGVFSVGAFVEKPDLETATRYLDAGDIDEAMRAAQEALAVAGITATSDRGRSGTETVTKSPGRSRARSASTRRAWRNCSGRSRRRVLPRRGSLAERD